VIVISSLLKLIDDFREKFGKELRKVTQENFGTIFYINRSRVRDVAIFLHDNSASLINIMVNDIGDKFEVIYEYFFKFMKENKFWFIITEVDKQAELDSIEIIYPQAKFYELEITKRYGLKFMSFVEDEGKALYVIPTPLNPKNKQYNLVPIGIYNKIHDYNHYFHLQVENSIIKSVVEKTGWLYRGILPLLKSKNIFEDNLRLTKRIVGPSSYHFNLAYIMAIEQLANIEINESVKLLRTLLCEFERAESHLLWFINLLYLLGYSKKYYYLLKRRNDFQNTYQKFFKIRFLEDLNFIGTTKEISINNLISLQKYSEKFFQLIFGSCYYFIYKKYVREKCEGIGILKKEDAIDSGVTGPCLRASGIANDIRFDKSYLAYNDNEILHLCDIITFKEGDVFARIKTRLWEMKNSYTIINIIFEKLINNKKVKIQPLDSSKIKLAGNKTTIVQLESPQGELAVYIKSADRPGKLYLGGIYIATPSFKNFSALNNYILKNNKINDFALIVHSMDLNFNEIDL